jgi:copper(I)-binding protein
VGNETASRTGLLRRLGPAVACGALGLALLTGCAAGQHAQTVEQTPAIDGVQAQAGTIAIRAAGIAAPESGTSYAKGSDAELRMVLVNQGSQPDKLVSVSSPAATGAELSAGSGSSGSGSSGSGSASPAASDSSSPSASASSSAAASASASSSASDPASASPSGSAGGSPLDLPPQQSVQIGISDGNATATLTGLTAELFSAQPIPVTLTFASGTSVTVTMAVQLTSEAPPAPTVSVATQQGGG